MVVRLSRLPLSSALATRSAARTGLRWALYNATDAVDDARRGALRRAYDAGRAAALGYTGVRVRFSDVSDGMGAVTLAALPPCDAMYTTRPAMELRREARLAEVVCDDATPVEPPDAPAVADEEAQLRLLCDVQFSFGRSRLSGNALRCALVRALPVCTGPCLAGLHAPH